MSILLFAIGCECLSVATLIAIVRELLTPAAPGSIDHARQWLIAHPHRSIPDYILTFHL